VNGAAARQRDRTRVHGSARDDRRRAVSRSRDTWSGAVLRRRRQRFGPGWRPTRRVWDGSKRWSGRGDWRDGCSRCGTWMRRDTRCGVVAKPHSARAGGACGRGYRSLACCARLRLWFSRLAGLGALSSKKRGAEPREVGIPCVRGGHGGDRVRSTELSWRVGGERHRCGGAGRGQGTIPSVGSGAPSRGGGCRPCGDERRGADPARGRRVGWRTLPLPHCRSRPLTSRSRLRRLLT